MGAWAAFSVSRMRRTISRRSLLNYTPPSITENGYAELAEIEQVADMTATGPAARRRWQQTSDEARPVPISFQPASSAMNGFVCSPGVAP